MNLSLEDYIKMIFLPSSSAYILGYKELNEHYENYSSRQKLETKMNHILEINIRDAVSPNPIILRQIQDRIFIFRKSPAIIPNWFAKLYKNKYDKRMQAILNSYK